MLLWLKNLWSDYQHTDECSKCIWRLCCTVYSICSTSNQWRDSQVIKEWGIPCTHISWWDCDIYTTRDATSGYSENCNTYTCNNIWPIFSKWLDENDIDIIHYSIGIWQILRKLQEFTETDDSYLERVEFINEIIFKDICSMEQLSQWMILSKKEIEIEFQNWRLVTME